MHRALHETEKQFKCHMCDKSFVTNRSLQEHVSTHTGNELLMYLSLPISSFYVLMWNFR